jgi:hypothetical protein
MQSFHFPAGWTNNAGIRIRDYVEKLSHFEYSSLCMNFIFVSGTETRSNQDYASEPEGDEGVRFGKLVQKLNGQQSHHKGRDKAN